MKIRLSRKLLLVSLFSLSWSLSIYCNKLALNRGGDPLTFTFVTTAMTAFFLSLYVVLLRRKDLLSLRLKDYRALGILGLFVAAAYVSGNVGLRWTTSINYSFLVKSSLVFVIILAAFFLREPLTRAKTVLMVLFVAGAYLLTTSGKTILPNRGDVLIIFNGLCFAAATILQKKLASRMHPDIAGWGRVYAAFVVLLLFVPFLERSIPSGVMGYLLIASVFNTMVAITLSRSLAISSAGYLTMMSMMVPVINSVLGAAFLHESLSLVQVIGGLLIIVSGVAVHQYEV